MASRKSEVKSRKSKVQSPRAGGDSPPSGTVPTFVLRKKDFARFAGVLAADRNLLGPTNVNGGVEIRKLESGEALETVYVNGKMSAKGCIFPETETLFRFEAGAVQSPKSEVTSPACVLFGIRPCDAMAFTFLDRVFDTKDYKEPRYLARRSVTLVATLACSEPGPACFCTSVNCAPDSEAGADIAMFELADKYLVKSVTEAGKRALEALASMLTEATKADLADRDQRAEDAKKKLTKAFDASALSKKLDDFHASFWDKLHQKCLGCAVCTYFCPTCHCFDITDETLKSEGRRVRTWDSCMFPLFALHASGHNPRPTLKERMRQRIMHKFNYAPKNYGQVFCVGCGRCVANCPVGIDIRAVLSEIAGRP